MTLLNEVMENPLDPSYGAAAASGNKARSGSGVQFLIRVSLSVMLGLGVSLSVISLRVPAGRARETRTALENQINAVTDKNQELNTQISALTSDLESLQATGLAGTNSDYLRLSQLDSLGVGSSNIKGPGVTVTLYDSPPGLDQSINLVRDVDLQFIASVLWASGAEAIAVGNQRLTMTSAIRNAGDAVLVDLTPVLGPSFAVTAIGEPSALISGWEASTGPEYLRLLQSELGIAGSITKVVQQQIPSASSRTLNYASRLVRED
jgi:uncharacterized protein YlxW (UPF0749 family)